MFSKLCSWRIKKERREGSWGRWWWSGGGEAKKRQEEIERRNDGYICGLILCTRSLSTSSPKSVSCSFLQISPEHKSKCFQGSGVRVRGWCAERSRMLYILQPTSQSFREEPTDAQDRYCRTSKSKNSPPALVPATLNSKVGTGRHWGCHPATKMNRPPAWICISCRNEWGQN